MKQTLCSALVAGLLAMNANAFALDPVPEYEGPEEAVVNQVMSFILLWEASDLVNLEYLLHNNFVSGAGESKSKYLARLRREAGNSAGRQITVQFQSTQVKANQATVKLLMKYEEQYKKYTRAKFYSSCQAVTLELLKWKDEMWYLTRERAAKGTCPPVEDRD